MNDENNFSAPVLDDIDYSAPADKKDGPSGVAAPVLDDIDYVPPSAKKGAPTGVAAPVLDDMDDYTPSYGEKKGAPTGVAAPVLDDDTFNYQQKPAEPEKLVLSDEDIIAGLTPELRTMFDGLPEDKKRQVIDMRRSQLGAQAPAPAISAPVLDEDNYTPPPKKEEPKQPEAPITAPILDDEPEPPKYVPKFVDEDLERAKQEGAKKAVSAALVSEQKDSKESLRMMLELKEQRRAELASKGFVITIVAAVIGVIAAVAFYLLYSGSLGLDYKNGLSGIASVISNSSLYIAIAMAVTGLLLISGIPFFKSLTTFVYVVSAVAQLFPGLPMLPQHEGSTGLAGLLFAVSFLGTAGVVVILSASEAVGLYFKKKS
ncbi:MAG: ABC transporter permease [Ruminococcus sp.]|nr:ABC transporter permease [Ruminococcus sp.]